MALGFVDYPILFTYFALAIGIGWLLRKRATTSADFLTSAHSVPLRITSRAFMATNLGAPGLIGMCAPGAKHGIMTSHGIAILGVILLSVEVISPGSRAPLTDLNVDLCVGITAFSFGGL